MPIIRSFRRSPFALFLACLVMLAGLLTGLLGGTTPASATLQIDITRGTVEPLPIAIPDFYGRDPQGARVGQDIARVITANLQRSGLFRPLDPNAMIQKPEAMLTQPRFADWKVVNAQALVTGNTEVQPDGRVKVEFRLWDVLAEQQLTGLVYYTTPNNWRRIAHLISDAIYKRLTGEDGYFDTRIVYIAESGPKSRRVKRLAIMDQDGENHRYLTNGRDLVLTPRFSPVRSEITYMSYLNNKPRVYLFNIDSGQQEVLGDFPGMTFAPRFSPDGNRVIMSLAQNGVSNIYTLDLRTRQVVRVTSGGAIDTSPSYSPDGTRIVFNSDRGGNQQLYTMNADGSNVQRISFGSGRYGTPVWSPRGDLVAFTKMDRGKFFIGVMRPDGSGERILTESFLDEGPTWAPNGRVIMFFRQGPSDSRGQGGGAKLWSVDITGHNERQMITPADGSDPAWSPLIQ